MQSLTCETTTAYVCSTQVALTNVLTFGKATSLDRKALPDERRFQFADTMTYSAGNHTFKFGADINRVRDIDDNLFTGAGSYTYGNRSEEHTSELQSHSDLVCRLLLEKKKKTRKTTSYE